MRPSLVLALLVTLCAPAPALCAHAAPHASALATPGELGAGLIARAVINGSEGPVVVALPWPGPAIPGWDHTIDTSTAEGLALAHTALRAAGLAVVVHERVTVIAVDEAAVLEVLDKILGSLPSRPGVEGSSAVAAPDPGLRLALVDSSVADTCPFIAELTGIGCDIQGPAMARVSLDTGSEPVALTTAYALFCIAIDVAGFELERVDTTLHIRPDDGLVQPPVWEPRPSSKCPPSIPLARLESAASGISDIRLVPHFGTDGEIDGHRITAVRRDSVPHLLDLKNGDILVGVTTATGTARGAEDSIVLLQGLPVPGMIQLEVIRRGEPVSWSCEVTE